MLSQVTTSPQSHTFGTTYEYGASGFRNDPSTAPAYLRRIEHRVDGAVTRFYDLYSSLQGQLLSCAGFVPGGIGNTSTNYSYDLRGRLTGETNTVVVPDPNNGGAPQTLTATNTYTYDAADNLNAGAGGNGWVYNADNQLTSAPAAGGLPGN
jgi:hypothetical protein